MPVQGPAIEMTGAHPSWDLELFLLKNKKIKKKLKKKKKKGILPRVPGLGRMRSSRPA